MASITTSIKSNKSSFPSTPYIQPLASLFPISIAVVPLYSAYLGCVCLCVLVCFFLCVLLLFMVALCNRADHIYFHPVSFILLLLSFFSSPNLSGRRLDVHHTSAHGVALVRI